jgi:hypothetical protein
MAAAATAAPAACHLSLQGAIDDEVPCREGCRVLVLEEEEEEEGEEERVDCMAAAGSVVEVEEGSGGRKGGREGKMMGAGMG